MKNTTMETNDLKVFGSTFEDVTATVNIAKNVDEDICISILTSEYEQEPFVMSAMGAIALSKSLTIALKSTEMQELYHKQLINIKEDAEDYIRQQIKKDMQKSSKPQQPPIQPTNKPEPHVPTVEAFRLGYDYFPKWFAEVLIESKHFHRTYQPKLQVTAKQPSGKSQAAKFGDYIIKSEADDIFFCTPEEFRATFKATGGSDESK